MKRKRKKVELKCPDCGSRMELRYVCVRRPKCNGSHGAHPNGNPMGEPGDAEVRFRRSQVHAALERFIARTGVSKNSAYRLLASSMGMNRATCHIGRFGLAECKEAMGILHHEDTKSTKESKNLIAV